jgi:glutamate transport system permease protein
VSTPAGLVDVLGPRARRRAQLVSVAAAALLIALLTGVVARFADRGQLEGRKWTFFLEADTVRFLRQGLETTLWVAAAAMLLAVVAGVLLALGRLATSRPLRWLAGAWVELFRALPLVLMILFSALGLPELGVAFDELCWYLVLALAAYNSAVLAEIFRAGILSLDRGQGEAAAAIGLGYWQSMAFVLVPQAVRRMVPAIVSQLVTLLKDTSLGVVIACEEFLRRAQLAGQDPGPVTELQSYVVAAAVYIVVNSVLTRVARRLEVRQRRRYRAGAISVSGVEDLVVLEAAGDAAAPAPGPTAAGAGPHPGGTQPV